MSAAIAAAAPAGLSSAQRAALAWLHTQAEAMQRALATLVNIDSSSGDQAGTDAVARAMLQWLRDDEVQATHHAEAEAGDVLHVVVPGREADAAPVLLMGHRDTVFPTGTVAHRPWRHDGARGYGPGVADMKSGLVLQCFVLRALQRAGGLRFPVVGLFTADEEVGSTRGRTAIERLGRGAQAAFNAEPARVSGNVVTSRKGGARILIEVQGRAAHAGVNHADGASAIEALARKIQALHALTDYTSGITANVGVCHGGMTSNTVAPTASAELDLRFTHLAQREPLLADVARIVETESLPHTRAQWRVLSEFLPLSDDSSAALMARYRAAAAGVGFVVDGEFTGGCSDAGFTAALGIPTLCGVGPVGGKAHTEAEYCELDSMVPRAQALYLTLCGMGG